MAVLVVGGGRGGRALLAWHLHGGDYLSHAEIEMTLCLRNVKINIARILRFLSSK